MCYLNENIFSRNFPRTTHSIGSARQSLVDEVEGVGLKVDGGWSNFKLALSGIHAAYTSYIYTCIYKLTTDWGWASCGSKGTRLLGVKWGLYGAEQVTLTSLCVARMPSVAIRVSSCHVSLFCLFSAGKRCYPSPHDGMDQQPIVASYASAIIEIYQMLGKYIENWCLNRTVE